MTSRVCSVVLCAAMGLSLSCDKPGPSKARPAPSQRVLPKLRVDANEVDFVRMKAPGQVELVLEKRKGTWIMNAPHKGGDVNPEMVQDLLANLAALRVSVVIEPNPKPEMIASFGVTDDNAVHVKAQASGRTVLDMKIGRSGNRGRIALFDGKIVAIEGYQSSLYTSDPERYGQSKPKGRPAGSVLEQRPDLLVTIPQPKLDPIVRWIMGRRAEINEHNCPELKDIKQREPFARRAAEDKARKGCKPRVAEEMKSAGEVVERLKICPFIQRFDVWVHEYQFEAKLFPVWTVNKQKTVARSGYRGEAVIGDWVLTWPGAQPFSESKYFITRPSGWDANGFDRLPARVKATGTPPCSGPLSDVVPVLSSLALELKLPEKDAKALSKVLHDTDVTSPMKTFVEVAMTVKGEEKRNASLACGEKTKPKIPGRALAWRVVHLKEANQQDPKILTPWVTAQKWEPPESCEEVRRLLGSREK